MNGSYLRIASKAVSKKTKTYIITQNRESDLIKIIIRYRNDKKENYSNSKHFQSIELNL